MKIMRSCAAAVLAISLLICSSPLFAQNDIFQIMERTDLKIQEVESLANQYFLIHGTGKGSGYKQYQRWLYERKFHTDEAGNFIRPEMEDKAYYNARIKKSFKTSLTWSELGPQAWTYTSGWNPGVGRITSVAIHPADTTKIYVSSPGGGIWKSINSGQSWTPLIDFVNSSWMSVFHLSIDPGNQSVIYAALTNGGVIKSTNAGSTWSATGSGPSSARQIKIHPNNSSIVFCAALNGLWRSTNAGGSWTQVQSATKEDIEFNPANPDIMYASGSSGTSCVWKSTDNGITWTAITSTEGITNSGRTLLAVSPANPAVVYAVQANGSIFGRLYKSTDTGATYTTTVVGNPASGTNYFGYEPNGTGTTGQATYDMAICLNPNNADEVHIAGIICWKSLNGGTSFTATTVWSYPNSTGYNHADVHALEWVNHTIYSGSDGGIYKSINRADDWIDLSAGLGIRQFYRISCSKTDPNVITTGAQDNGSSFRRSNGSWVDWLGADGMDNAISPTNAAIAIGTSQNGALYKTTNSGASRSNLPQASPGNWVTPVVMNPVSHDTLYVGWTGVWRSVNGGTSWTNLSPSITVKLDALAVAPSNTAYIYASQGSTLYRTADGGSSWSTITAPATVTSIFVSKSNPAKIWITCNSTTNRVYTSTDAGSTFTNLSAGLPSLSARSVVVDEDSLETIYVGMNIGVYYRDNANNTWYEHASGLPLVAVNEVEIQKSGNKLRVATYGRGVWESDLQNIPAPCGAPSGLSTASITTQSAVISWNATSGAVSYKVDYKATTDANWTELYAATTQNWATITGLNAGTSYLWQVRTNCSSANSSFSSSSFTTAAVCDAPSGLQSNSISSTSAILSWNQVSGALNYSIDYKATTDTGWTVLSASTGNTSITLGSLSPSTAYDWRIRTNCSTLNSSFATASFNTLSVCSAPQNLTVSGSTGQNIKLSWNAAANALTYTLEYKMNTQTSYTVVNNISDTLYTFTSLNAGIYNFRVSTQCSGGSSASSDSITFTVYCHSAGLSTSLGYIDYVYLGAINRSSGTDQGYFDGTNLSASVKPGVRYTLTVSPGYSGAKKNTYFSVFIDYNQDGDFGDAGELVKNLTSKSPGNSNITITIPSSAMLGSTRMRVVMSTNAYQGACVNYANGETEDYTLNVTNTPDAQGEDLNSEINTDHYHLYPVPANQTLFVAYHAEGEEESVEFKLIDLQGKVVLGGRCSSSKGENLIPVDISAIESGNYLFQMLLKGHLETKKIVISH